MKKPYSKIVVFGLLLGLVSGCKPSEKSQTEISKAVVNQFAEILNTGNLDRMDELFTPDFVRHSQAGGDIQNLEEYKQYQQKLKATFPDQYNTINIIIAEGNYVAGYNTLNATQNGAEGPYPPAGKKMKSEYIWIFRMEDGKIAEIWVEWDNLAVLTQLGHFPPSGESKE
jgi:steroid delta-isomerase-like uncharacterized protein